MKHLRPPSPKRPVAETARRRNDGAESASPKRQRRTVLDRRPEHRTSVVAVR